MRNLSIFVILLFAVHVVEAQNKTIDSLKQQLTLAKEDTSKVLLLVQLSDNYTWSYADTSLMYAKEALQLAQKLNYRNGVAKAHIQMCAALITLGNYPLSLDNAFKALSIYEEEKNDREIIRVHTYISLCYREQGDYSNALKYSDKALQLLKTQSNQDLLPGIWGILGATYVKYNQPDSAIKYLGMAYKTMKDWSGLLYVLGDAYAQKGHSDSAMYYYKMALPIAEAKHVQKDFVDIYNGIASIYKKEGKRDSAIYYASKGVQQEWAKTYPAGKLQASTLLADLYEKGNKGDSTLKYLKLSIALKDSLFNQERTRASQNFAFNEQQKQQELATAQQQYKNRVRIYVLGGGLVTILIIALLLYRNNLHKQKSYGLLQKQKQETDQQRAKAEEALQELKYTQTQLVQREKMASLGELTSGIAHEIQNPLNFVNNFSEVSQELLEELKQEAKNPQEVLALAEDLSQNLQKIHHHGKRADAIVKGMLQHSRASSGEKQLTDLNALTKEYLRLAYHGFRNNEDFSIHFTYEPDVTLPKLEIVPQEIGRVLLNVFNNAFYATAQKKATLNGQYQPQVAVITRTIKGKVEIRVKDNGIGIPESIKQKIFQPFFTTKPTGEGTGLGLSLSYDIIAKGHSGELRVDSQEGEFTEITITLPN